MKYGNPNYGGMKGILSNSWKRRYHSRRLHRDVVKKRALLGDEDVGRTPPYKHHRSGLVNVPEEEEEEEEDEQDMEEEEGGGGGRVVVEYRDELQAFRRARERSGVPRRPSATIATASSSSSSSSGSDSDEMDYDLELKMISTPSPKKSLKMTMYADEVESQLKSIRNSMRADSMSSGNIKTRIGNKGPPEKKVTDVRLLLEEKRQGGAGLRLPLAPPTSAPKSDVRQRLGKRPHSPETPPLPTTPPLLLREPLSDVHSRLGIVKQDPQDRERDRERGEKKKKKAGALWARLGSAPKAPEKKKAPLPLEQHEKKVPPPSSSSSACLASPEEEDSALQRAWGALIQGKAHSRQQQQQQQQQQQKSRLDHLPSLQIEISREESSSGSEADS
nr:nuclear cap-binding protein subunit 3 [Anolis sagrei ordinatus]